MHSDLIDRAEQMARAAHDKHVNPKSGETYIHHPARVAVYTRISTAMLALPEIDTEHAIAIAWLHDTVEDTWLTQAMIDQAFLAPIGYGVHILTRADGLAEDMYYSRIRSFAPARAAKWADMLDNTDPLRLGVLQPKTVDRLVTKYERGAACLEMPSPIEWWRDRGRSLPEPRAEEAVRE